MSILDELREMDIEAERKSRPRERDSYPTLIGECIPGILDGRNHFPFKAWAVSQRFEYPTEAADFLQYSGSAAEAFFVRSFCKRPRVQYPDERMAFDGTYTVELQVRCAGFYIDAVVQDTRTALAIEIDGTAFHRFTAEQIQTEYIRQRRLVLKGHTVVRFTAREVFVNPEECWRQIEAIMESRGKN